MTIQDLIAKKDYDSIDIRYVIPDVDPKTLSFDDEIDIYTKTIFAGLCKSKNGTLISLDGDTYSPTQEVVIYNEFVDEEENITAGITIIL